jgi:hypothetical protein
MNRNMIPLAKPSPRANLNVVIRPPLQLTPMQRQQMYRLMSAHFSDVDPQQFAADLDEKQSAVLLCDLDDRVHGFTTLLRLDIEVDGQPIVGYYSGDTVIDPAYWGEHRWLRVWSRHVFGMAERLGGVPAYWVLLTATHRTYRIMASCFREHYPSHRSATPMSVQRTLDCLVRQRFPREYDRQRGIVRLDRAIPVRPERVHQATAAPLDDPVVRHFVDRNPGYLKSDYLACLTLISRANCTPLGLRILGDSRHSSSCDAF